MSKKTPVPIDFRIMGGRWVATGPDIHVEAEGLQSLRKQLRGRMDERYGPGSEYEASLHVPEVLKQRVEANRRQRQEVRAAEAALRADTIEIIDLIRHDLGGSYDDAAQLLGVDKSVLNRLVKRTRSTKLRRFSNDE